MKKVISLILMAALCFSFAACGAAPSVVPSASTATDVVLTAPAETEAPSVPEETAEPAAEPAADDTLMNIMVLNGTTGFGMAKLITDSEAGTTEGSYSFSVETDASNILGALINGTADIAALPTNAASVVYNKSEGAVKALALNTKGVLYVVTTDGSDISSLADLEGKTVYAPAQNPTFIFSYICGANDVNVTVDNSFAQPVDLRTAVTEGSVEIAVLPEPMVTIAKAGNENVKVALDLTEAWDEVSPEGSLVQGCVVVRSEFAEAHPAAVELFLTEYEESVNYLLSGADDIAAAIEGSGVFAKGAVAVKAIPNCNICFVKGEEMKEALSQFLEIMFTAEPKSIGGKVPADDFYYLG